MEEIKLDVELREKKGRRLAKVLRRADFVPAVVYGAKRKPTNIKVNRSEYERIMRAHKGQSVLFHINVMEGEKKLRDYSAIVKEEQHEPVKDTLLHIDFKRVSLKEEIEVQVQIVIKGEAVGVKKDGGSVDQPMWELDVVCLPTNIPESIEVQIDDLEIGDAIHVKDIKLPQDVKTKHDPESIVVSIVPPMKEEEEAEGDEDSEPEVIGEKKEGEQKEDAAEEEKAEAAEEKPAEEKKEES